MMQITQDIRYIGVNDHQVDLFEGQYRVPNGMAYNSYLTPDEKTAVIDTVDHHLTHHQRQTPSAQHRQIQHAQAHQRRTHARATQQQLCHRQ